MEIARKGAIFVKGERCEADDCRSAPTWKLTGIGPNCGSWACCGYRGFYCDDHKDGALQGMPGWDLDAEPWQPAVFCEVPTAAADALMEQPCPFCGKNVMGWTGTRRQGFATLMHGDPDALAAAGWSIDVRPI